MLWFLSKCNCTMMIGTLRKLAIFLDFVFVSYWHNCSTANFQSFLLHWNDHVLGSYNWEEKQSINEPGFNSYLESPQIIARIIAL